MAKVDAKLMSWAMWTLRSPASYQQLSLTPSCAFTSSTRHSEWHLSLGSLHEVAASVAVLWCCRFCCCCCRLCCCLLPALEALTLLFLLLVQGIVNPVKIWMRG